MKQIKHSYLIASCRGRLERISGLLPDGPYLRLEHLRRLHRWPDLDHPRTYSEKLNWLKMHYRPESYRTLADKYAVREYVAERIGGEHLIPLIGHWDSAEDIDISLLPDQFVLKCNHDSGSVIVCRDKATFDFTRAKRYLNRVMRREYFLHNREWSYKGIKPCILGEQLLAGGSSVGLEEYKFHCFDGRVEAFVKCGGTAHTETWTNDYYDREGNFLPVQVEVPNSEDPHLKITSALQMMMEYAELLSGGMPYVRVDFLCADQRIFFGEMTFYPWGGFARIDPPEWDLKLGDLIHLPEIEGA